MIRERIFVSYRPIKNLGKIFYHMSLNYIDVKGNHHVIDAGPTKLIEGEQAAFSLLKEELFSKPENNTDSAFEQLVLNDQDSQEIIAQKKRTYRNGQIVGPYTMIETDKDLSELWSRMGKTASKLNGRFEYRPASQNSNTFVGHILRTHGYKNNLRRVYVPDEKSIRNLNIPGAYQDPKYPLKGKTHQNIKDREERSQTHIHSDRVVRLTEPRHRSDKSSLLEKGPERVKTDPSYNPFNIEENGFEDLEGEAFIWKTNPSLKDKMIVEAGRANFFGIDRDPF